MTHTSLPKVAIMHRSKAGKAAGAPTRPPQGLDNSPVSLVIQCLHPVFATAGDPLALMKPRKKPAWPTV